MIKKLRSRRGETLLEVLISVLVVALSAVMLATMVAAATKVGIDAEAAMDKYYKQVSAAEGGSAGVTDNVKITYNGASKDITVSYYGSTDADALTAYKR